MNNSPECYLCDMQMIPIENKYRAWECPICQCIHRKVSPLQFYTEKISMYDQMIAKYSHLPKIKANYEKELQKIIDLKERSEKYKIIHGEMEEWTFKVD